MKPVQAVRRLSQLNGMKHLANAGRTTALQAREVGFESPPSRIKRRSSTGRARPMVLPLLSLGLRRKYARSILARRGHDQRNLWVRLPHSCGRSLAGAGPYTAGPVLNVEYPGECRWTYRSERRSKDRRSRVQLSPSQPRSSSGKTVHHLFVAGTETKGLSAANARGTTCNQLVAGSNPAMHLGNQRHVAQLDRAVGMFHETPLSPLSGISSVWQSAALGLRRPEVQILHP